LIGKKMFLSLNWTNSIQLLLGRGFLLFKSNF
jgi:hypothetical protein